MKKLSIIVSICLIIAFCLSGCGGPTPTETADTFLTAVKAGDTETLKTVYEGDSFDFLGEFKDETDEENLGEDEEILNMLLEKFQNFDYELSNEQIDGDKATVDVKITTYDIGGAFTSFVSEYFSQALPLAFSDASEEQIEKLANTLFENEMNKLTEKTYTDTVTLKLAKEDDVWKVSKIKDDGEVMNALTGNMIKTFENLDEAYSFDE